MDEKYDIQKLTDCKWANLYEVDYNRKGHTGKWIVCSRKQKPIAEAAKGDAVVVVPILHTPQGNRLVVTREFRVPIWDYEYGFPAGIFDGDEDVEVCVRRELKEETGLEVREIHHVSMPVFSTAGLSDESCHMVLVTAMGTPTSEHQEASEDIEVLLLDAGEVENLLASKAKVAAKAWGLLYHFAMLGEIRFTPLHGGE